MPRTRRVKVWSGYVTRGADPPQWQHQYETQQVVGAYQADPGGGPAQWSLRALPWLDGVTRQVRYINSTGSTGNWHDSTGALVAWGAGSNGTGPSDATVGRTAAAPWLNLANIASLSSGSYLIFVNASTDNSAPATHTARLTIPANVDVVLVPVVNGAILKTGGTGQSRCFDIANNSSFLRLRRGLGNAVFQVDAAPLTTNAARGIFQVATGLTGTYGVEIDGAHKWIDSASGTFERAIVFFNFFTTDYNTVLSAPSGTPTFIFKNGFKLCGETAARNIRGVAIGHLGSGTVTIDGMNFAGSANIDASSGPAPRSLNYKGLFNVETGSPGTVRVNNTYGTFTATNGDQVNGLRVMDCNVTASNLAHKLSNTTTAGAAYRPTWFGGFNQNCSVSLDGYTCEVTGTDTTPAGNLLIIGEDGKAQPLLSFSSAATGSRTVTAEFDFWDMYSGSDVGRVLETFNGSTGATTGSGTITAVTNARVATINITSALPATLVRAFRESGDATNAPRGGAWRIANKVNAGTVTNVATRGPGTADATDGNYTLHGITIGGCANVVLTDSVASYCAPGLLNKDTTDCEIRDCRTANITGYAQHLILKGAVGSICTGNTLQLASGTVYDGGAIRIAGNDYGEASTGGEITGNTIRVPSASFAGTATCGLFKLDSGCDVTMGGNEWHMEDGGAVPAQFDYAGSKTTFANYRANVTGASTDYSTP